MRTRLRVARPEPVFDTDAGIQAAVNAYGAELYGFACRALDDHGLAEEAVQEVFVRAWRASDRFDPSLGSLRTWLFAILRNVIIDAAILSLQHSFIVDNYQCGDPLQELEVNGAIAQKYRGPVGTGNGSTPVSGFIKDYEYDDRFRYRSPPYFLNPIDSAWDVIRSHEQVPAR